MAAASLLNFVRLGRGLVTLAMHRLPPTVQTPAELLTSRREEWAAPDDGTSWGFRLGVGRLLGMPGVEAHPDSILGDLLAVLRVEVQMKRGLREWVP